MSPRLVVQAGLLAMFAGIVWLFVSIDVHAGADIVTIPLLLAGLGIGALASQLGSVTVSAVPDSTKLAGGIPFLSDAELHQALIKAGASKQVTRAVLAENQQARLDGLRTALAALALLALVALFFSARIPAEQPGSARRRPETDPAVAAVDLSAGE